MSDTYLNKSGLIKFATDFHDRVETEIGNDNLIDTYNLTQQVMNGYQVHDGILFTLDNKVKNNNGLIDGDYYYGVDGYTSKNILTQDGHLRASAQLTIVEGLKPNTEYTLSFDCSGVPENTDGKPLRMYITNSKVQTATHMSSDHYAFFNLTNGHIKLSFVTNDSTYWNTTGNEGKPVLFLDASRDSNGLYFWYPLEGNPQNIHLNNFVLKRGKYTTKQAQSLSTVSTVVENKLVKTSSVKNDNWLINVTDDSFIHAIRNIYFGSADYCRYDYIENTGSYASGVKYSDTYYMELPYALVKTSVMGNADTNGRYISNINFLGNVDKYITGFSFKIFDPSGTSGTAPNMIRVTLNVVGRRATPDVTNPTVQYDASIVNQIIDIAETYIIARNIGRQFYYGKNFLYRGSNIVNQNIYKSINSSTFYVGDDKATADRPIWRKNAGMGECDTFVSLILRGIPYDQSPYYICSDSSEHYTYEELYQINSNDVSMWESNYTYSINDYVYRAIENTQPSDYSKYRYYKCTIAHTSATDFDVSNWKEISLANPNKLTWVTALDTQLRSDISAKYLLRDVRFASDDEWLFWNIPGALFDEPNLFTSTTKVRPGDIAFWRKPGDPKAAYFDSVTHVALVGYDSNSDSWDENNKPQSPDFWVYEWTGLNNSSGYTLNKRKMSSFENFPTRFARPYGFNV